MSAAKKAARKRAKTPARVGARRPGKPRPAHAAARKKTPTARTAAKVAIGQAVADFSLPAAGSAAWRLEQTRGSKLVLYFYPRDNTPGCTLEGQQFAALAPRFAQAGVQIVGISRDSVAAHERFRTQQCFPFALLSDVDGSVCRQFDVIREKSLYGRKFMGIERSTFLLDAALVLRQEWRRVRVDGHAAAVLEAAQAL